MPHQSPALRPLNPLTLRWSEVDPARHRFDRRSAAGVVRGLPAASRVPAPSRRADGGSADAGDAWVDDISRGLVRHYGRWASGWCWGRGESQYDGGPVAAWCCPAHSISKPPATLRRVEAGLVEWRSWVEELETWFRELSLAPSASDDDVRDVVEHAVALLVTAVAERTEAESGWYQHCRQVLGWYLAAAGVPDEQHAGLLADATGGRFHSWSEPTTTDVAAVARRLAGDVPGRRRA